jgi:hypothetical protein
MSEEGETVATYLGGTFHAILYDFDNPTVALAKISFPGSITVGALEKFVLQVCPAEIDHDHDLLLLYPEHRDAPAEVPLQHRSGEIAARLSRVIQVHSLFTRRVRGIAKSELVNFHDTHVLIADNGSWPNRRLRKFLKFSASFREIRDLLVSEGDLSDVTHLRVWTTFHDKFSRSVTDLNVKWDSWETIRFDIVPQEQWELGPSESPTLVHILDFRYNHIPNPFWCLYKLDEPVDALFTRVQASLGPEDEDMRNVSLVFSWKKNPSETDVIPMTGTQTVQELIDGQTNTKGKVPRFFVLCAARNRRGQRHSYRREESLTIAN